LVEIRRIAFMRDKLNIAFNAPALPRSPREGYDSRFSGGPP
jgi:hypothetical protein